MGLTSNICDVARRSALFKRPRATMVRQCRFVWLCCIAAPPQPQASRSHRRQRRRPGSGWNPAADYITAGQDEPGYRCGIWRFLASGAGQDVQRLSRRLPRSAASSRPGSCSAPRRHGRIAAAQPFEIPPTEEWPNIVQTLRYIRDYVIPALGPVEPVSVYRNPVLNACAGGAPESAHKLYSAIDMVPLRPTTRETMMRTLCADHSSHGEAYHAGLGFYAFLRFHVDTTKFRRWNMDPAVAAECPPIVHPEDSASVGQPLQSTPTPTRPSRRRRPAGARAAGAAEA